MRKPRLLLTAVCLGGALLLGGCVTPPTTAESYKASGFIDATTYAKLQADEDGSGALIYRTPGFTLKDYHKVMVDPIKVWYQGDVKHQNIDPAALKALTDYFHESLAQALEPDYPLVNKPGPQVLRIRAALTDISPTNPAMSVVMLAVPFGGMIDIASGAGTGSTFYLGDTAIEAKFHNSETDELLAAYVEKRLGKKYDLNQGAKTAIDTYTRSYSTWGYAKQAFDYWAQKLRRRLDEAHGVAPPKPAPTPTPASTPNS